MADPVASAMLSGAMSTAPPDPPLVPGSKLPANHENPVDALIIRLIDKPVDVLHHLGVSPNAVTALSALTSILSIHYFLCRKPVLSASFWLLSYVLDCVDGLLARRYGLETKLGDKYDHYTDVAAFLGLAACVLARVLSDPALPRWPLAVEAALLALSYLHMHCQQRGGISAKYIPIEGVSGCACPWDGAVRATRWAGMGTLLLWHLVLIARYAA